MHILNSLLFLVGGLKRITIQVPERTHRALKLLGIVEGKSFGTVVKEAIEHYLEHKGAYQLDVAKTNADKGNSN